MRENTRIAVVEIEALRETIRAVIREELDKQSQTAHIEEVKYKETDKLSINQVAEYLDVSTKTVSNYRRDHKLPEPEYNLSGKPR
jgi:DNA-binding transcriptional regulator YiaG